MKLHKDVLKSYLGIAIKKSADCIKFKYYYVFIQFELNICKNYIHFTLKYYFKSYYFHHK